MAHAWVTLVCVCGALTSLPSTTTAWSFELSNRTCNAAARLVMSGKEVFSNGGETAANYTHTHTHTGDSFHAQVVLYSAAPHACAIMRKCARF